MIRKRLRKKAKEARELVPDRVVEHATQLNPLAKKEEPGIPEKIPQITNETIAVHREEVLKGARKYIYPLQHSKRRIIVLTSTILAATFIAFMVYSTIALYRLNQYNTFLYRTSQVVPFPIARIGDHFIAYENYLFELRHYVHYYENQLGRNFAGNDKAQLVQFRKQALDKVENDAYIKILADQNKISVSNKEVDARITQVRAQNRLGGNNKVFADVLRDYWGWSVADFRRSLKQQILSEKVVAKLDKVDSARAQAALDRVKAGEDFSTVATQVSDDPSAKVNGGDYGFPITKNNPNVSPAVIDNLFKLKDGQYSGVINTGPTLEIVKIVQASDTSVTAKHIVISLKDVTTYTNELKSKKPSHNFVKL